MNSLSVFLALSVSTFAAGRPVFRNSAPLDQFVHDAAAHAVERFNKGGLTPDKIAITVIDLADPKIPIRASYRGEESTYPASVVKLFYLVAAYHQIESGVLKRAPELERALHDMIVDSSNDATQFVVDMLTGTTAGPELGEGALHEWLEKRNWMNRYFAALGYDRINVNQKTWCEGPYGRERQGLGPDFENRNRLTTDAVARLWYEIVTGRAASTAGTRQMMSLLHRDPFVKSEDPDDQATAYSGKSLPPGSQYYSKAGWTSTTRHDTAYIRLPNGAEYILAVFTVDNSKQTEIIPFVSELVAREFTQSAPKAGLLTAASAQFTPRTLRLDYVHTGDAAGEQFALDGLALEGDWPGPLDRWIDDTNLGPYRFQVFDSTAKRLIYSRGFASIFGEWRETGEATQLRRAFHESIRLPAPSTPVRAVIQSRGPANEFHDVWSVTVDPSDSAIDRSAPPKLNVWAVMRNGAPRDKVDLLLLGDGYTAAEMDKWHRDARRTTELLFAVSPFKEHRQDFNVWAIDTPAEESGVSRPSDGVYRHSPLGAAYDAFGSERYVLTFENKRLREIARAAPYEFIEIVVNGRKYGGGGIFNLYATVAADNAFTPYVFVHEFGHHFAGLADEYYTSDVAYGSDAKRPEPWAPNATADPHASKWSQLLSPGIDLPTLWPKQDFEEMEQAIQKRRRQIRADHRPEEEMEKLFAEERTLATKLLGSGPNAGKVGAFEGALYEARGNYRPQQDCIMFTRDEVGFCSVCRRAIERIIKLYAK